MTSNEVCKAVAVVLDEFRSENPELVWRIRERIMGGCDLKCAGGPCYPDCVRRWLTTPPPQATGEAHLPYFGAFSIVGRSATGMEPGQRCTRHRGHGGEHQVFEDAHWTGPTGDWDSCGGGGRCTYVESPAAKPPNTVDSTDKPKAHDCEDCREIEAEIRPPAPPTPTCEAWCGRYVGPMHFRKQLSYTPDATAFCAPACRDAARSLHPRESR